MPKTQQCHYDKANFFFFFFFEKKETGDGRKGMNIRNVLLDAGAARHHGRL